MTALRRSGLVVRWCVLAVLLQWSLTACGQSGGVASCPALAAPDVASAEGWFGYLAAHPDDVAVVDDGRGGHWEHRADVVRPMASTTSVRKDSFQTLSVRKPSFSQRRSVGSE